MSETGNYSGGTERCAGELERFAIDRALIAAWTTEFWIPADPDYGFVDYFEAAAARNFDMLHGLEDLAEDADRRGILPSPDCDQTRLVTDGGTVEDGTDRELIHGDTFELLRGLETDSAHCAVVDYPWEFDRENGTGRYTEFYETELIGRFSDVLSELSRVLVDGSWLFAFADDGIQLDVHALIEESDFNRRQTCVWDFGQLSMGAYHRIAHYPILTATVGETDRQLRSRGTIYRAMRSTGAISIGHERPTSKPVDLYRQMLEPPVLEQGERLIEPFAGTAPGLSVCQERDLDYWGADIDAEIVEERQNDPATVSLEGWTS